MSSLSPLFILLAGSIHRLVTGGTGRSGGVEDRVARTEPRQEGRGVGLLRPQQLQSTLK